MPITNAMVMIAAMFFGVISLAIVLAHKNEATRLRTGYYDDEKTTPPSEQDEQ